MKSRRVQIPVPVHQFLLLSWDVKAIILSASPVSPHLTRQPSQFPLCDVNILSIAGTTGGFIPTQFLLPAREGGEPPEHTPIPPLPSCSKARATPNVSDVSLAIVHGWATLNGQLVHRPAPYNGPLFPYNLFSAFPSFMKRNFFLSLSPVLSFCSFAPSLGFGI